MSFCKNGNVKSSSFVAGTGGNILRGTRYTEDNKYKHSGSTTDIYTPIDSFSRVTPGKEYYLTAKCSPGWAIDHTPGSNNGSNKGKCTIWLYLSKTYNESNMHGYDYAWCYHSLNWIKEGLWKVTMPSDVNMARIRVNTYSDGSETVTTYFWDINLIPAEDFCNESTIPLRTSANKLVTNEMTET